MDFAWENKMELFDLGNIIPSSSIKETHVRAYEIALAVGRHDCIFIALGGGHDFGAPGFLGYLEGFRQNTKKCRAGLVNVDPHLDVRELENDNPHSGTPFREILESKKIQGRDFVQFGTRANRNSRSHFEYCKEQGAKVIQLDSIRSKINPIARYRAELSRLRACQVLGTTFDMDSCSDAEGTSAAPVIGFSAWELCQFAYWAGQSKNARFFEIAEVAPPLDPTERSARIAAEMIYYFLRGRSLPKSR
jgi:formiminoglutamase